MLLWVDGSSHGVHVPLSVGVSLVPAGCAVLAPLIPLESNTRQSGLYENTPSTPTELYLHSCEHKPLPLHQKI